MGPVIFVLNREVSSSQMLKLHLKYRKVVVWGKKKLVLNEYRGFFVLCP